MRNEVIFDAKGIPSIMVVFTPEELGNGPACKITGKTVKEIAISKYPNTMINGLPYSLPFHKPAVNISFDDAVAACEAKGAGWHLMTNAEWAALAHISKKNGTLPRGNTNSGKSHSHPEETGTTYDGGGKTLAGSGPAAWNHDHTPEGVADLCGDIWEMVGGVRWLNGQPQIIPDNNAAAGADQSKDSAAWEPVRTADGSPVYYRVDSNGITLTDEEPEDQDYDGIPFADLDSEIDVPEILKELALYPDDDYKGSEYFWLDSNGERVASRGGSWYSGTGAGVFDVSGRNPRSNVGTSIGFRSAFVRYIGQSDNPDNLEETTEPNNEPQTAKAEPNAGETEARATLSARPRTLPEILRDALASTLSVIYKAAGSKDLDTFAEAAHKATDVELQQAAALSGALAQASVAAEIMRCSMEQLKLANTFTLTIGKEADHE